MKLLSIWVRHQNRMFWRTPVAAFFTLGLPLFMMLLFVSLFEGDIYSNEDYTLSVDQFFVPSLAVLSVASATYTNLAISSTIMRDERILKRVRGTPVPPGIYILSAVISAIWVAILGSAIMLTLGILIFNVDIAFGQLYWMAIFFTVGVIAFSFLGLGVSTLIPSGRAAPAVTNATIFPLAFISDIFFYIESPPRWLDITARIFPLKNFAEGFRIGFDPSIQDEGLASLLFKLGIMILWGLVGFIFMLKYFVWVPKVEAESRKPKRSDRYG